MRFVIVIAAVALCACTQKPTGPTDNFDRKAMLTNISTNILVPAYDNFASLAEDLHTAATEYAAVGGGAVEPERTAARDAWRDAMALWQFVEVFQVGPADDLRDEIYSWPTTNACFVDREIVEMQYANADFHTTELVNVYGLDALEYLLFYDSPDNSCDPTHAINAGGSWAALSPTELAQRRADYAVSAAAGVLAQAQGLHAAWDGGFTTAFSNGTAPYANPQDAIDTLFAAMFYGEIWTKDEKLAVPSGLDVDCLETTCPEELESLFAQHSAENLVSNVAAMQMLFLGGAPEFATQIGFDDFLVELGAPELAQAMTSDMATAVASVEAIPEPMSDALANDLASVHQAHADLKKFTDNLKSQFITVLNLKVPDEGAGDND